MRMFEYKIKIFVQMKLRLELKKNKNNVKSLSGLLADRLSNNGDAHTYL